MGTCPPPKWNPKQTDVKITVLSRGACMGFHVSLGEGLWCMWCLCPECDQVFGFFFGVSTCLVLQQPINIPNFGFMHEGFPDLSLRFER